MMQKLLVSVMASMAILSLLNGQPIFQGTYTGAYEGDEVRMELSQKGDRLSGEMHDSFQNYVVEAVANGDEMSGTATESSLGLVLEFTGKLYDRDLLMQLNTRLFGELTALPAMSLRKTGDTNVGYPSAPAATINPSPTQSQDSSLPSIPAGYNRDTRLCGVWYKEENYNSPGGFGGYSMSSTTITGIAYHSDGRVEDLGSRTVISSSDAFGDNSGNGQGIIPNLTWATRDEHLFLIGIENGQTQQADLGHYYIENSHLLITGNNGEKLLLRR